MAISKNSCQYEIGNRFVSWRRFSYVDRSGREDSKLVFLHGAARFQLALVSQWTVATVLGLRSRDGTGGDRKIKCTTRLGALDVPRSSAHKAEEFVGFQSLFTVQSLVCPT